MHDHANSMDKHANIREGARWDEEADLIILYDTVYMTPCGLLLCGPVQRIAAFEAVREQSA